MALADLPELQAELVRQFRLTQELPQLDLIPAVLPVVQVAPLSVTLQTLPNRPAFRRQDMISSDALNVIAAGTQLIDTGELPAGIYDCQAHFSASFNAATGLNQRIAIRRGDPAAAPSTQIVIHEFPAAQVTTVDGQNINFTLELDDLEHIFFENVVATLANDRMTSQLAFRRRS